MLAEQPKNKPKFAYRPKRRVVETPHRLNKEMDPYTYLNGFNNYVNFVKNREYRSKNPDIYTFSQKIHPFNKFKIPEPFVEKWSPDAKRRNLSQTPERVIKPNNDDHEETSSPESPNDNYKTPQRPNRRFSMMPSAKRSLSVTPPKSSRLPEEGEDVVYDSNYKVDQEIRKPRNLFSYSKMQQYILEGNIEKLASYKNFNYLSQRLLRTSFKENKIISRINIDEEKLNLEEIKTGTIEKIKEACAGNELHGHILIKRTPLSEVKLRKPDAIPVNSNLTPQEQIMQNKLLVHNDVTLKFDDFIVIETPSPFNIEKKSPVRSPPRKRELLPAPKKPPMPRKALSQIRLRLDQLTPNDENKINTERNEEFLDKLFGSKEELHINLTTRTQIGARNSTPILQHSNLNDGVFSDLSMTPKKKNPYKEKLKEISSNIDKRIKSYKKNIEKSLEKIDAKNKVEPPKEGPLKRRKFLSMKKD